MGGLATAAPPPATGLIAAVEGRAASTARCSSSRRLVDAKSRTHPRLHKEQSLHRWWVEAGSEWVAHLGSNVLLCEQLFDRRPLLWGPLEAGVDKFAESRVWRIDWRVPACPPAAATAAQRERW